MLEDGDLIVISGDMFGDMIKSNPEIAVRMLRKQSIRLRDTNKQLEQALTAAAGVPVPAPTPRHAGPLRHRRHHAGRGAWPTSSRSRPGTCSRSSAARPCSGRYDSVTGMRPDVDLTNEDQSRNISRRHARLVTKDGKHFVAEEIGTMNGTYLNGKKLANGVLTPDRRRGRADAVPSGPELQDPTRAH